MLAHNSVGYLCISLGAMCLGAVSLNLNWRQPTATTRKLLTDLSSFTLIRVLVASKPFKETAQEMHRELGIQLLLIESVCAPEPDLPFPPPVDGDALVALKKQIGELPAAAPCAVFFTGGTTGTPKAVPHTHYSLLWYAKANLQLFPEPFADRVRHAGTVCFTPYFHVMGFCANFVFNLNAGCRAFILATHEAKLSPQLMIAAIHDLKPSCCNTIPYIVEGMVELIKSGHPGAAEALASLHLLTYGGAALPPHCAPILSKHGVTVACTYGQTELAGPVMFGRPGGDPNALRPLPGVSYELVRGPEDEDGVGELVLLGNGSATNGYLQLGSDGRKQRSLTGEGANSRITTHDRFCTGDRFRERAVDGGTWLFYLCREDDLLVHTSGEMTNPLPTEQAMLGTCAGLVDAAACVGNNLPRALLMVELSSTAGDQRVASALLAGLEEANRAQPNYSHVLPHHVLLMPHGSLPRTVKGTVQRHQAERLFAADLAAIRRNEPPVTAGASVLVPPADFGGDDADGRDAYDSLAATSRRGERGGSGGGSSSGGTPGPLDHLTGIRTLGCLWIVCAHFASREPKMALANALLERSHLVASAFVTMSGFGMMWAHGAAATPMPPAQGRASSDDHADGGDGVESVTPRAIRREGSLAHLYRWYVARLHRVIVTYWVAMLLTMAVEFWAARTVHPLSELVPCAFLVATWQANATIPNWRSCPNGPAWYISALVPSWLLFPFAAPLIRLGMRRHLGWPLLVALPLLSALSVLPVSYTMRQPGFDRPDANPANLMFYFPPANLADFYAGACAAALAKLHRPTVARLLAVTTAPPANYTTILWAWRHRAEIVWAWAADIAIYTFVRTALRAMAGAAAETALYHSATLWVASYLYLSVSSGGLGMSTGFLRCVPLVSLGEYALHVYLFQEPFAQLFARALSDSGRLDHQWSTSPWQSMHANTFVLYLVALWSLAAAYVHWMEGPCLLVLRRLFCACGGSVAKECGRRPGSPLPTSPLPTGVEQL